MPQTSFVLLHGAWHTPSAFSKIVPGLQAAGLNVVVPQLPSSGASPPVSSFDPDVATIRETVTALVDQGHDVLVVMHSYAGIPGGNALEGLDAKSRSEQGKPGGVIRLVYIMSFLVPEGFQFAPTGTSENFWPEMVVDFEAGITTVDPAGAKDLMYQDVNDDSEVQKLIAKLKPQSIGVFWSKTTHAAWRTVPTTYVICTKDRPTTVTAIRGGIEMVRAMGQCAIDRIIEREVGHSPFISQPEWTVEMLKEQAGAGKSRLS